MYKKSIILLKNKAFAQVLRGYLQTRQKELEHEFNLLADIEELKRDILTNKNTVNLRKHFSSFIIKNGFPYLMVLDFRADLGLPQEFDPDGHKILHTFLISFSILAHTPSHENKTMNMVLLLDEGEKNFSQDFLKDPSLMFNCLKTRDERANTFINNICQNKEKGRKFINLSTIVYPAGQNMSSELSKLDAILKNIDIKLKQEKSKLASEEANQLLSSNLEPARIICRPTGEKLIENGEIRDVRADEKLKYFGSYVSVEGAIIQSTSETVKKRIIDTLSSISKLKPINKDAKIVFLIPDSSVIDTSFATSMGIFFTNLRTKFPNAVVDLGEMNLEKVKHSPGFIAMKGLLVKAI